MGTLQMPEILSHMPPEFFFCCTELSSEDAKKLQFPGFHASNTELSSEDAKKLQFVGFRAYQGRQVRVYRKPPPEPPLCTEPLEGDSKEVLALKAKVRELQTEIKGTWQVLHRLRFDCDVELYLKLGKQDEIELLAEENSSLQGENSSLRKEKDAISEDRDHLVRQNRKLTEDYETIQQRLQDAQKHDESELAKRIKQLERDSGEENIPRKRRCLVTA